MKALAERTEGLKQSSIRAITLLLEGVDGINLGQGICDMPTPDAIKAGAHRAIDEDRSIYSHYGGIMPLQEALKKKANEYNQIPITSIEEIMVTVGATGAFVATMFTLLNPGDEVIVFEPYYGYHCDLLKAMGTKLKFVHTSAPDWAIDFDAVDRLVTDRTKAIIVTTPGNPSGKVWSRQDLETLVELMERHDIYAITDEIYEYMLYDGHEHISLASIPGAFKRTITLSGFSKTYNMTGWRIGYAVGPEPIIAKMGLLADLIYICAPTPLQYGVAEAFGMSDDYFKEMGKAYDRKRTLMCETLEEIGFVVPWPEGSYYVLADFSPLRERFEGFEDDMSASQTLVDKARVGTVTGRSFFEDDIKGASVLRFCFAKEYPILEEACRRLKEAFPVA